MEIFAAWLKAEASLHTPKLEADLVLLAAGLKAEASLHTPKRFAQLRPLISQLAVNDRDEQSFLSSPGRPKRQRRVIIEGPAGRTANRT